MHDLTLIFIQESFFPHSNKIGVSRIARRSSVNTVKPPPPVRRSSSATPSHYSDSNVSTILNFSFYSSRSSIISAMYQIFSLLRKEKVETDIFFSFIRAPSILLSEWDCLIISILSFKDFCKSFLKKMLTEDNFIFPLNICLDFFMPKESFFWFEIFFISTWALS